MSIGDNFKSFCKEICFINDDITTTCEEITKKLNNHYYNCVSDGSSHLFYVGSVGRGTAVKNTSDVDLIFNLPSEIYAKYNSYDSNGQSALLQDIKEILKERYPKTTIRGDGQVVVIEFDLFTVELVPAFLQDDMTFKYPDTHDGGSWKTTNPISEQKASQKCDTLSNGIFRNFCRLIRAWKNEQGISIGGLLIDSLIYKVFCENNYYSDSDYPEYYAILCDIFSFFGEQNKNQSYWYALGSNQKVYSSSNIFIQKANNAYEQLIKSETKSDKESILVSLFGSGFPHEDKRAIEPDIDTEEFIEKLFPVDIRYDLTIDCIVSQKGFRDFSLRKLLLEKQILRHNKKLSFSISNCTVPRPYDIYWKVRNVGPVAIQKKMIRGQIVKTNSDTHSEHTNFQGPHYVECYIVKNGVCVARDKIDVPIGSC